MDSFNRPKHPCMIKINLISFFIRFSLSFFGRLLFLQFSFPLALFLNGI